MRSALEAEREHACDDEVAGRLVGRTTYVRALLGAAERALRLPQPLSATAAVDPRTLESRVVALLSHSPRPHLGGVRVSAVIALLGASAFASTLFSLSAHAAGPADAAANETPGTAEVRLSVLEGWSDGYAYSPEGRRDPFEAPTSARPTCHKCEGLEQFLVQEVALRGIVETPGKRIALLLGPDGRTYFASRGQRLLDGSLTEIERASVVFTRHAARVAMALHEEARRPE